MILSKLTDHLNSRNTQIFPPVSKKIKNLFFIILFFSIVFLSKNIFAQNEDVSYAETQSNIIEQTQDAQSTGNNAEAWHLNSWNTNSINLLTSLTGKINFNEDGTVKDYKPAGMLGTANNMIASMYRPQASGIQYLANLKNNFLSKPTYAQGVAFNSSENSLQPLLPAWTAFRNITYSIFSLFFIITGIMIMLRVKISPQVVITIQSAIPKLITSLILVTFSYAIAGLIIDISYVIQSLAIFLIFQMKGVSNLSTNLFSSYQGLALGDILLENKNIFNLTALNNANFSKLNLLTLKSIPISTMFSLTALLGEVIIGTIVGGLLSVLGTGASIVGQTAGAVVGGVVIGAAGGIIMIIAVLIMVIFWLITLWFGLLKTYVSVIIQIITAPFTIGIGALPNSKIGFSSWIIDLIAKVTVFPVVLITSIFIAYLSEIVGETGIWIPNLIRLDINTDSTFIGAAVGIAGLALLSKLPDLIPAVIYQLKPSPYGVAIGDNLNKNAVTNTGRFIFSGATSGAKSAAGGFFGDLYKGYTAKRDNSKITEEKIQRTERP